MPATDTKDRDLFLVTGAAGFVGSHLVRHLHAEGIAVRAMVRREAQAEALRPYVQEVVIGDLERPETLRMAAEGCAGVYHVAAIFRQEGLPDETFRAINAEGVRHMLDAAIAAGVPRFVHCSTNGVHSDIDHPPADESYPFNPGDIYQVTKAEGERIAMAYFEQGRIGGVILRPTMIYGPGDARTLKLFRMIAKGRFFYVGRGEALTHWVDVRDLARAFQQAMEATDINAEAFLIGGRRYMTLAENAREIAAQLGVAEPRLRLPVRPMMALAHATEIVCKPIGVEPPLFRRRVAFFIKNRAYDISKAREMLKFEPRQDFAGEVRDIIAAYRAAGDLPPASAEQRAD
ncbi:NAD-dependent epimerase/dehydratase family protein [Jannaschia sp. S6380]|uniref:NAD-dependent epimerase/dehydratase family protein n=1 Tax=Jannaschia sp. S6380 TaxID=2926408 RepID=UPI001FF61994|nr:NAD-dependent epimerase/dehydratase family protein [Jannaschia sp. S6380]MCK0168474.1 NAD-dependent epimerase/dehydratase family protein [Jannaschia sp. S6380]